MVAFQWIMIPVVLVIMGIFYQKLKKQPILRLMVILILVAAEVFLIVPDLSTQIAAFLGIGRGVDLLIYLSLFGLTLACVLLYQRTLELQSRMEDIIRQQSLKEAEDRHKTNTGLSDEENSRK